MASLLKNLEQRFSTTRYLRGSSSTELVRAGGNSREWLVARELCLYVLIDCSNVPAKKRHSFVEIAVRRMAPFPDPECHVVWTDRAAMTWIWPRSRMTPDEEGVPLRSDADSVYPESAFLGQTHAEGAMLQQTSAGVEGRIWRDGALIVSNWWPTIPDLQAWNEFCRGAGLATVSAVPAPSAFELQLRPWSGHREANALAVLTRLRTPALAVASFSLALALVWPLAGLARLALARNAAASEEEQLKSRLGDILLARDKALQHAASIDAWMALRSPRPQTVLMARVATMLDGRNAQIIEWSAPDREHLSVTLRMSNPDPVQLVKLFEDSKLVTEVTSDNSGAGELVIRGRILAAPRETAP